MSDRERDLLARNNLCGAALLSLVSRGNAILAELLRLASFVPSVFQNPNSDDSAISKYAPLIYDFNYFKTPDHFEQKIAANPVHIQYLYDPLLCFQLVLYI